MATRKQSCPDLVKPEFINSERLREIMSQDSFLQTLYLN